jgi:hypothetical protein
MDSFHIDSTMANPPAPPDDENEQARVSCGEVSGLEIISHTPRRETGERSSKDMKDESQIDQREANDGKKTPHLVRGSMLLLLGAWMAVGNIRAVLYGLRMGTFDAWYIADTVIRFTGAAFFISCAP